MQTVCMQNYDSDAPSSLNNMQAYLVKIDNDRTGVWGVALPVQTVHSKDALFHWVDRSGRLVTF